MNELPVPRITPDSRHFWDIVSAGRFEIPYCRICQGHFFYPRHLCPSCHQHNWEWRSVSGRGTIESFTVLRRPATPAFREMIPITLATIRLHEGPRFLVPLAGDTRIGAEVEPDWDGSTGLRMPTYRLVPDGGGLQQ